MSAPEYARDSRWWLAEKSELHTALFTLVRKLRRNQGSRREMYRFFAELYGSQELGGLGITNYDAKYSRFTPATLPYNVVRSGVNTLLARIAKNKPLPLVVSEHGNWGLNKRARGLTRYLEGEFGRLDVFRHSRTTCLYSLTCGTGLLQIYADHAEKRPAMQKVFPWECLVEPADGRYGTPRSFYTYRWFDRTVLKSLFPKHAEAVDMASSDTGDIDDGGRLDDSSDVILVVEAWHLPSSPKAKDGRHSIVLDTVDLFDEKWTKNYFPFAVLKYAEPLIGYWGTGLAEELSGWQYEINFIAETLHLAHRAAAAGMWLVPDNAATVDSYFTDEAGIIVRHKPGFPPQYINPTPAHPQTYQYMESLRKWSMQDSGISQMAIHGEKPPGIVANKALETLEDQEDARFALFSAAWDELHCGKHGIADQLIDVQKELAEEYGEDITVMVPNRKNFRPVKWSDVDMDRDAFVLQQHPVGFLSTTPATRLQQAVELFDRKVLDRSAFLKAMDSPDLGQEQDVDSAARQVVEDQVEQMMDADDPEADDAQLYPEPMQDLTYALYWAQQQYNLGILQKVPPGNLRLLLNYMDAAKGEIAKKPPPPPPMMSPGPSAGMPAPAAGAVMPGPPMPPPGPPMPGPPNGAMQ